MVQTKLFFLNFYDIYKLNVYDVRITIRMSCYSLNYNSLNLIAF